MPVNTIGRMPGPRTVSRSAVEGGAPPSEPPNPEPDAPTAALAPPVPEPPPTPPSDELNNEQLELERAIAAEQEAFQLGEKARQDSLVTQAKRSGGDVNHEEANTVGDKAAEKARQKMLKKRPAGVYVTSPIKVRGEHGHVFAPVGFRLTDWMVKRLGDAEIKKLEEQDLVQDLR